jgi:hypothetical protein
MRLTRLYAARTCSRMSTWLALLGKYLAEKLGPALCELMGFMVSDKPKDKEVLFGLLQVTLSSSVPVWAKIAIYEKKIISRDARASASGRNSK